MNKLTEYYFDARVSVFTLPEIQVAIGGSTFSRHGLIKRAIANNEIINLRRGLYCLAPRFQKNLINTLTLAQAIHGPSYISSEMALSYHGWIPEAVYTCTSTTQKSSRDYKTPLGLFSYQRVPQSDLFRGVQRVVLDDGHSFFMATAIKALADYVYLHRLNWTSLEEISSDLRIELDELTAIDERLLVEMAGNYSSRRVKSFLLSWQNEVFS